MSEKNTASSIISFLESLKASFDSGFIARELKYKQEEIVKKLNNARSVLVTAQQRYDLMKTDPNEVVSRVSHALQAIEKDYPRETKFLNMLVEQKLAPESFQAKIVDLMCDVSEAQSGLVGPDAVIATINNYVEVLDLLRDEPTLRAEMDRLVPAA